MAWIVVHKRMRFRPLEAGEGVAGEETSEFAWTETWEKMESEWKLTSVTSTRKPD